MSRGEAKEVSRRIAKGLRPVIIWVETLLSEAPSGLSQYYKIYAVVFTPSYRSKEVSLESILDICLALYEGVKVNTMS